MLQLWQTSLRRTLSPQQSTRALRWRSQLIIEPCFKCRFSTSTRTFAQKKAVPLQRPPKVTFSPGKPTLSTPRKPAAYESLSEKLALRSSPTLLYQASSYNHYIIASYMVGGFLISVAAFNAQTPEFARPGDLPAFVPVFAAVGSFMIACIGFWMCLKVRQPLFFVVRASSADIEIATEYRPNHQLPPILSKFQISNSFSKDREDINHSLPTTQGCRSTSR
jgi:hypothetical protein